MSNAILGFKNFFENSNLVFLIDELAKRYGELPSKLLNNQSLHEFSFNVAVMLSGKIKESEIHNEQKTKHQKTSGTYPNKTKNIAKIQSWADVGLGYKKIENKK